MIDVSNIQYIVLQYFKHASLQEARAFINSRMGNYYKSVSIKHYKLPFRQLSLQNEEDLVYFLLYEVFFVMHWVAHPEI